MPKPNIVYLHSHDTGRYVRPYGHAMPTPNLQRLAEDGVLFRRAFTSAPTCSASRSALLTGKYAHEVGMVGLAHLGFELNDYGQHLANVLRPAGYTSVLAGMQHVAPEPTRIGYDRILDTESSRVEHVVPAGVDFLRSAPAEPFFLDIGFFETHRVFPEPGPEDDARYCLPPAPLPDNPETRKDMAAFRAAVRVLDDGIGTLLDTLAETGLADNTLIVCTTDHGLAFPHMKCTLTDHGLGAMLIMRGPAGFTGGRVVDAMTAQLDIFPTICELAGIEAPPGLRGMSLLPLINGEAESLHEELFGEVSYHAAYEPQRSVRTERFKYIRRYGDERRRIPVNCDAGPSKSFLEANGWDDQPWVEEHLFDLYFDPNEAHNLVGDPAAADVLTELRGRLDRWMRETSDPLLHGPVPAPAGAVIRPSR